MYTGRASVVRQRPLNKDKPQSHTRATYSSMTSSYANKRTQSPEPKLEHPAPSHPPRHLLKLRVGAFLSGEAPSDVQEAHVMPNPAAHLKHAPAVGDGLREVMGCLAS